MPRKYGFKNVEFEVDEYVPTKKEKFGKLVVLGENVIHHRQLEVGVSYFNVIMRYNT